MTPEQIKETLSKNKITPYQLAKDYELSESHLSMILSGKRSLTGFKKAFFKLLFEKINGK